ncbi:MAG: helix-turn-helix transcriptional regulator [Gammaproteobacteria bacterium]
MKSVKTFQFTLNLKNIDQSTPNLEDRLYDANCDDALIHFRNGAVYLDFDREAASLEEAIISAIKDVKSAFMDAEIASVSPGDLVTEAEIAKRLDKTRQMVSLWIKGERRKLFPQPIMRLTEKSLLWSWSEVTNWLHENGIIKDVKLVESARLIANINAVLKESDETTREFRQKLMSKMGLYNLNYHGSNRVGRLMESKNDYAICSENVERKIPINNIVKFDFNQILNIASSRIRRTAMFLGLGLNAVWDSENNKYLLSDHTIVNFIPMDLNKDDVEASKKNFPNWLIGNGLREVDENFELFLLNIYQAIIFASLSPQESVDSEQLEMIRKKIDKFSRDSLDEKFKSLNKLGIILDNREYLLSIKKARNCLTHRLGRVDEEDCNDEALSKLTIEWCSLEIFSDKEGLKDKIIDLPFKKPVLLDKDAGSSVRISRRSLCFKKGELILLSPKQINEICFFYSLESEKIKSLAVDIVRNKGCYVGD